MSLLVDTSVWSLALRRDTRQDSAEVRALYQALLGVEQVFTTGLILQELLQGFSGSKARTALIERLGALGFLQPDRDDYVEAAELRNSARRRGVQIGTIDALLIQLCRRHELTLLSADHDFHSARKHIAFGLWGVAGP
jgi:predicted nucleic acid-binding protein